MGVVCRCDGGAGPVPAVLPWEVVNRAEVV